MAKGYSDELRVQVVAFINEGHTVRQAAEKFGVSPSFAAKPIKNTPIRPKPRYWRTLNR